MSNDLLSGLAGNLLTSQISEKIADSLGMDKQKTQSVLAGALPVFLSALKSNSQTPEGEKALQNALNKDHDGSILENLNGYLENPAQGKGESILKHVLGDKKDNVTQYLSNDSGLDAGSIGKIMEVASPILMGMLGKQNASQAENQNPNANVGIGGLLSQLTGTLNQQSPQTQSIVTQLLDKDGDGSIVDDISEMGMSFLGKMFKK